MGIDRQRIVDNFYPAGSEVADVLHPVRHPRRLRGRRVVRVRPRRRPRSCSPRRASPTASRPRSICRDAVRGYLPNPTQVATDIQAQLKTNLNIDADDRHPGDHAPTSTTPTLASSTACSCSAGVPTTPTSPTSSTSTSVPAPRSSSARTFHDIIEAALKTGATTADQAGRNAAYAEANKLIKAARPDGPGRAWRLGGRVSGRRRRTRTRRRWATSCSR